MLYEAQYSGIQVQFGLGAQRFWGDAGVGIAFKTRCLSGALLQAPEAVPVPRWTDLVSLSSLSEPGDLQPAEGRSRPHPLRWIA